LENATATSQVGAIPIWIIPMVPFFCGMEVVWLVWNKNFTLWLGQNSY
jgi:hypothetical protein